MALPTITPLPTAPSRSDAPATFITRADAFIAALPTFRTEIAALGDAIVLQSATSLYGSSTTNLAIGTGSKSLTIQTGKGFQTGQFVMIANTASPTNYMLGQVTSYDANTGALVVNVASTGGSGTLNAWTISLAPTAGGVQKTGDTMTGPLITAVSATGAAGLNVPHGTAPTAPNNGDVWSTTTGLFFRINGVTRQGATLDGTESLSNKTVFTVASATGSAGLRAPHGTAPTSPTNGDIWTTASGLFYQISGVTLQSATLSGTETLSNKTVLTVASATGGAGFRIPHGAAPTSPTNGDIWTTTGALFFRINGVTRQAATLDGTETLTNKTITDADATSTIKDGGGASRGIGFRGLPPRAAASAQVLSASDNGTEIEITSGGVTVPTGLPTDFVCMIFNNSGSAQTITQGSGVTLRLAGTATTGNRTLAAYGLCTIRGSATANLAKISGSGVS